MPTKPHITTTLGALTGAEAALGRLLKRELPLKLAYHVSKLAGLVAAETRPFHQQREALIRQIGTPIEGDAFQVPPEKVAEFIAQINDALTVDVTIPWGPITLASLDAVPDLRVPGQDLLELGPLFEGFDEP